MVRSRTFHEICRKGRWSACLAGNISVEFLFSFYVFLSRKVISLSYNLTVIVIICKIILSYSVTGTITFILRCSSHMICLCTFCINSASSLGSR